MTEQKVKEIRASYEEQTVEELFLSILTNIEIECGGVFSRISICSEDIDNYITLGGIVKNKDRTNMRYFVFTFERELLKYPRTIFSVLESPVKASVTMLIRGMILLKNELCVTAKRNKKQWTLSLTGVTITCGNWNEFVITCFEIGLVPVIVVYENSKLFKGTNERYENIISISELAREDIQYLESKIGTTSESLKMPYCDVHDYTISQCNSPSSILEIAPSVDRAIPPSVDRAIPPLSYTRSSSVPPTPHISKFKGNKKRGGKNKK